MQPFLPFLRPFAQRKPSAVRQLLRFSSSARRRTEASIASNPSATSPASTSATESASSAPSTPSASISASISAQQTSRPPKLLSYHVLRSATNNLPVYQTTKRGGNLKQTKIRKIQGNAAALRADVQKFLGLDNKLVVLNPVTNHVDIKGWHKAKITEFLLSKNF